MQYITHYDSPLGNILLAADETGLTGLWFEGQKFFARGLASASISADAPLLKQTRIWLDLYFSGRQPETLPALHLRGTPFQQEVWNILLTIPYGKTMTYGQIAAILAARRGIPHFSAQAVGSAVGRNPVSILVPCHRVLGTGGQLTGYAGGVEKKAALLALEQSAQPLSAFFTI